MKFGQLLLTLVAGMNTHFGDAYGTPAKFDHKQTFKAPLFVKEAYIPYFNKSGDALIDLKFLRLVPSMDWYTGSVWATDGNPHKEWMVEFSMLITGRSSFGGDGFVFWYADEIHGERKKYDFYGENSVFKGVAIVFDAADFSLNRINPYIYAIENDGTKSKADFENYTSPSVNRGSCFRDYRNSPKPVWVKIIYKGDELSVDIDIRQGGTAYSNCMKFKIDLPVNYHFGLSATTSRDGGGKDDHDFLSFETYELNPKPKKESPLRPYESEDIAAGKEFKMTKDLEDLIEKTEKITHEMNQEKNTNSNVDQFGKIIENQFHILEAVDNLHATRETGLSENMEKLRDEVQQLLHEISELRNDLKNLENANLEFLKSSHSINSEVKENIGKQADWLQNQVRDKTYLGTSLTIFASFAGLALVGLVYSTCIRGSKSREKKFV